MLKRIIVILVLSCFVLGALTGCGTQSQDNQANKGNNQAQEGNQKKKPGKITMNIPTGGLGGVFYVTGAAIGTVVSKYSETMNLTGQVSQGSTQNVALLKSGEEKIAVVMNEVVKWSQKGEEGVDKIDARTICAINPYYIQISIQPNIKATSMRDFVGKKAAVGTPASAQYTTVKTIFDALDLKFDDFKVRYLSIGEMLEAYKDGDVDVAFWQGGIPQPAAMETDALGNFKLYELNDEEIKKIKNRWPDLWYDAVIPGGTYKSIPNDLKTVAIWATLIVNADFPEEQAYEIAKILDEHYGDLVANSKHCATITPENTIKYSTAPLHPGVVRYYKEKGYIK